MFGLFRKRYTVFFAHFRSSNGDEHHKITRCVGTKNSADFFDWIIEKQNELPKNTVVVTCNMFTQ